MRGNVIVDHSYPEAMMVKVRSKQKKMNYTGKCSSSHKTFDNHWRHDTGSRIFSKSESMYLDGNTCFQNITQLWQYSTVDEQAVLGNPTSIKMQRIPVIRLFCQNHCLIPWLVTETTWKSGCVPPG